VESRRRTVSLTKQACKSLAAFAAEISVFEHGGT